MIQCDIKGCKNFESELLSSKEVLSHWVIFRACRCGAYDHKKPKSCTCSSEGHVKISYWPNLDWWAFGGVDQITLCPEHKLEVMREIVKQQINDPSMDQERPSPYNRH